MVGDRLYFFAYDDDTQSNKLYSYVPGEGATLVRDVNVGGDDWHGGGVGAVGGKFYFAGWQAATGEELWVSDPATGVTRIVSDIVPGADWSSPQSFIDLNGILLFQTQNGQLYRSDGTKAGTYQVSNITPEINSVPSETKFVKIGEAVYLSAKSPSLNGVWRRMVRRPGPPLWLTSIRAVRLLSQLTAFGTSLLFTGDDFIHGIELWRATLDDPPLGVTSASFAAGRGLTFHLSRTRRT